MDHRALQGPKSLHLHGPPPRIVPKSLVHNHLQEFDSLGGPPMKRHVLPMLGLAVLLLSTMSLGQQPLFKVLAFYSTRVEPDHVRFAEGALKFFTACAARDGFAFEPTTNWENLNDEYLEPYTPLAYF